MNADSNFRGGRPLSPATVRAYEGDINAVLGWCSERGIAPTLRELDARRVFSYCLELRRQGRSSATVRRKLTALRAELESGALADPAVSVAELFEIEKRVLRNAAHQTGVLVLSDDPITRAGLRVVLTETGALCWSDNVGSLDPATMTVWDYILVWVGTPVGIDRFGSVAQFNLIDPALTTSVPVVAVHSGVLHPVVRLRLAEAGFRYAVPHIWLASHLGELSGMLSTAELPVRFHLGTAFALRQELDLMLSGTLAPFLEAAISLPPGTWTAPHTQQELPVSRHSVRSLRRMAHELAGVPAPEFGKYSAAVRRAPEWPEWSTVRVLVRAALGIEPRA